jgi:SAM-dependent methyltransferase
MNSDSPRGEFDEFAEDYTDHIARAIPFSSSKLDYFARVKARKIVSQITNTFPSRSGLALLDVGCGVGLTDEILKETFPHITGLDVSAKSLELAAQRNPELKYRHYNGGHFPFEDQCFDVVFAICVLHHIPPAQWPTFFANVKRILKLGGLMMIFEHNPWNPLTRLVVYRCEFDRDAVLISAPECHRLVKTNEFSNITVEYFLLSPWESKWVEKLEAGWIKRLPIGAQYSISAQKKLS